MRRAGLRFYGIVATLAIISACGGPTGPSKITETAAPPAPGPSGTRGTIALVSATPSPGAELGAPSLSATFSVTVDRAIPDAALEVHILDANNQSCGFAATDRQNMTAGQAASFTVAALPISCSRPATLETLVATLVGVASSQRTEYLAARIPAHYSLPEPDKTVTLRGTVTDTAVGVAGASVDIVEGANTGKGTTTDGAGHYVLAGLTPGAVMVRAWKAGYDNTYHRVTLSDSSTTQDFGVSKAPPAAAPLISELVWKVMLPVGGDPPLPGDPVSISCTARETDGAPMTVTITLTWDGRAPNVYTNSFPAGASSSPAGARLGIAVSAPHNGQAAPHAKLECVATNVRGETARKSTDIGRAPQ